MRNTALYITMHGASMADVIFMPRGASVVELMPYMWRYGSYQR